MKNKKISINLVLVIVISLFTTGCFCVKKLPQSKLNPVEYVFPISKSALTDSLINNRNYYFGFRFGGIISSYVKDSGFFNIHFSNELHLRYNGYGGSYVYRKRNRGKQCFFDLKMRIDSLSSDSCCVKIIDSKVKMYTRVMKMVDMWYTVEKPIPSTTIEEYEILRKIGRRLGILNQMPLVNYPDGLTRDQIRMSYGHNQDFTYEEMFGEPQPESEKDPIYTEKELKKRKRKGSPPIKFDYHYCK